MLKITTVISVLFLFSCADRKEEPIGGGCSFDSIIHPVFVTKISKDSNGVNLLLHSYEIDSLNHTITTSDYKGIVEETGKEIQVGDTLQVLGIKSLSSSCNDQKGVLRFGRYRKELDSKF